MKIAWKKISLAAVLGYASGKALGRLKDRPDVALPILQVSAASGVVGGLVGWTVSVHRKHPSRVLAISLAANFAIVSGTFLTVRTIVHTALFERNPPSSPSLTPPTSSHHLSPSLCHYFSSTTSGGITGALTSLISRYGLHSILLTSVSGIGMGLCAQAGYNLLMSWRRKKAIEQYHRDMGKETPSRFEKWTFDNFEARFLRFWHQHSESIETETEMLSLETAISEERQKLVILDKQLADNGVDPSSIETDVNLNDSKMNVERSMVSL